MTYFELSAAAAVPQKRIVDFENNVGSLSAENLIAVQSALEAVGVEFLDGKQQPGVRLRKGTTR
jgi:hypothetical protein